MGGYTGGSVVVGPGGVLPAGTAEGQLLQWNGSSWVPGFEGSTLGDILVWDSDGLRWRPAFRNAENEAIVNLAIAEGRWEPDSLHNNGGTVDYWTNLGQGGPQYTLYQFTGANQPTYSAAGNRSGGPAATFVRATPTSLQTAQFRLAACTCLILVNIADVTLNQHIMTALDATDRSIFCNASTTHATIVGGGDATIAGAVNNTWYGLAGVFGAGGGLLARRGAGSGTAVSTIAVPSDAEGLVMGDFGLAAGAALGGVVERAYMWNRELTTNEIQDIFDYFGV